MLSSIRATVNEIWRRLAGSKSAGNWQGRVKLPCRKVEKVRADLEIVSGVRAGAYALMLLD
jgi:hypothetical protein